MRNMRRILASQDPKVMSYERILASQDHRFKTMRRILVSQDLKEERNLCADRVPLSHGW